MLSVPFLDFQQVPVSWAERATYQNHRDFEEHNGQQRFKVSYIRIPSGKFCQNLQNKVSACHHCHSVIVRFPILITVEKSW